MKVFSIAILFIFLLLGCKKNKTLDAPESVDTIPMLVTQVQKCSRLYSAEVKVRKIITHTDEKEISGTFLNQSFNLKLPVSQRKLAIPIDATIKAYIDFNNFSSSNIIRNKEQINIILPDPQLTLTSSRIDHSNIKQYVALMRSNFTDEELAHYEQEGRKAIIKDIPKLDVLELARISAAKTLIPIFVGLGFKEENITITFRKELNSNNASSLITNTITRNESAGK
ncbi:DUF4230 domain-containing protein [Hoylesella nanceiensis]|uniref:DUF4230 domain-containing protein n=1 Tax=Hoylesella nanceiensis TaxID=425941 RepID=UPI002889CA29|nr:DUF4230 domain-containing protein [Hoylesella nanceiensis]